MSVYWVKAVSARRARTLSMSVIGCTAENICSVGGFPLLTPNGHPPAFCAATQRRLSTPISHSFEPIGCGVLAWGGHAATRVHLGAVGYSKLTTGATK